MFSLVSASELLMSCQSVSLTGILLMDLYEIRGGRLGVIAEEAEHQELEADLSSMHLHKGKVSNGRGQATPQKSLPFEEGEQSSPSPTGADDGYDDMYKEEGIEVRILLTASTLNDVLMKFLT